MTEFIGRFCVSYGQRLFLKNQFVEFSEISQKFIKFLEKISGN